MSGLRLGFIAAAVLAPTLFCGCGLNLDSLTGAAPSEVQPMDQYRQDAAEAITSETAEAELSKLEEEIEAEIAADQ